MVGFPGGFRCKGIHKCGRCPVSIELYAKEDKKESFFFHPPKLGDPPVRASSQLLRTTALISRCAVARAQYLGQIVAQCNSRSEAGCDFWRATFFAAGVLFVARIFFARGGKPF